MSVNNLFEELKSKDKKVRFKVLDNILKVSRSNNISWKKEFLDSIIIKSSSTDWEERYVAMYAITRFIRKSWNFEEFEKHFLNIMNLIEDTDGRVRIAARNALEHFRTYFIFYPTESWEKNKAKMITLWKKYFFDLAEKTLKMDNGKMQMHLVQCTKILFRTDMEDELNEKEFKRYEQLWRDIDELDEFYYQFGVE